MTLPTQYEWLFKEPAPRMLLEALKLYGLKETVGSKHTQSILDMAAYLGIDDIYTNDELAWCGLAMAYVIKKSGKPLTLKSWDILRALKYINWGNPVSTPELGDLLIFQRKGGGHVALYIGEDDLAYHVLGGNQSNTFNIMRIEKSRLVGARRLYEVGKPANVRRIFLSPSGKLSKNEQ